MLHRQTNSSRTNRIQELHRTNCWCWLELNPIENQYSTLFCSIAIENMECNSAKRSFQSWWTKYYSKCETVLIAFENTDVIQQDKLISKDGYILATKHWSQQNNEIEDLWSVIFTKRLFAPESHMDLKATDHPMNNWLLNIWRIYSGVQGESKQRLYKNNDNSTTLLCKVVPLKNAK